MATAWNDRGILQKVVTLCTIAVSAAVVVLAVLQLAGLWENAGFVYLPLLGIELLLQAYTQWKQHRSVAIFSICVAAFTGICYFLVFFSH